jgi:exodeoxyribonuclease VII large subunit
MLARPSAPIAGLRARVAQLRLRLGAGASDALARADSAVSARRLRLARHRPDVGAALAATQALATRLRVALAKGQDSRQARLQRAQQALAHLDPGAVLQRGYALALDARGHVVTDAGLLGAGDRLDLRLARGRAAVRVEDATVADGGDPAAGP